MRRQDFPTLRLPLGHLFFLAIAYPSISWESDWAKKQGGDPRTFRLSPPLFATGMNYKSMRGSLSIGIGLLVSFHLILRSVSAIFSTQSGYGHVRQWSCR